MNKNLRGLQIAGIGFIVLGVIHDLAAFVVLPGVLKPLPASDVGAMVVMFEATGTAILFAGWLVLYARKAWCRGEAWPRSVVLGTVGFVLLVGAACVAVMPDNPFAYVSVLAAVFGLTPFFSTRHEVQK